jgi:hypothetical protein
LFISFARWRPIRNQALQRKKRVSTVCTRTTNANENFSSERSSHPGRKCIYVLLWRPL